MNDISEAIDRVVRETSYTREAVGRMSAGQFYRVLEEIARGDWADWEALMRINLKTNVTGSERGLRVSPQRADDDTVIWTMFGANPAGDVTRNGVLNSNKADAVAFAVELLKELAPERLAPPTIADYPPGTFLRNSGTGEVVQVVEWDDNFKEWRKDEDGEQRSVTAARRLDGSPIVPFDDGTNPKFRWEPVEVEVETKTVWTVK